MAGFFYARESGLNLSTPSRGSGSPPQLQKLFPALLGSIPAQVFTPLEQGRLTVGHLPTVIDKHPWIAGPSLLITMKPADPTPVLIDQPALSHRTHASTYVLARVVLNGQAMPSTA